MLERGKYTMKYDGNDRKVTEYLKNLPKINDPISKDELYRKVSSNMSRKYKWKRSNNMKNKLIPIFSTALVIVIIFILVPSFIQNDVTAPKSSDIGQKEDRVNHNEVVTKQNTENDIAETKTMNFDHYILHKYDRNDFITFGAFPDDQVQYIIPVTFNIANGAQLNNSNMQSYYEESWGNNTDFLDGITFTIDENSKIVHAHLSEEFSLGEGSSKAGLFEDVLTYIYAPMGMEKVLFTTNDGDGIDLGPIGTIDEFVLKPLGKALFKMYHPPADDQKFLVPIRQDSNSLISEALNQMKQDEDTFHITGTVPTDIDFDVEEQDKQLIITFSDQTELEESQDVMTMIEAILITAKTYGFESVLFNGSLDQIGHYDLTSPIDVPVAVNPINIS